MSVSDWLSESEISPPLVVFVAILINYFNESQYTAVFKGVLRDQNPRNGDLKIVRTNSAYLSATDLLQLLQFCPQ